MDLGHIQEEGLEINRSLRYLVDIKSYERLQWINNGDY